MSVASIPFRRVLLTVKESTDPDGSVRQQVAEFFNRHGVETETSLVRFTTDNAEPLVAYQHPPDLVVVIGGDGTFLRSAQALATLNVPMVGINRGNLGFLTRIEVADMEPHLEQLLQGGYFLEKRMLLKLYGMATDQQHVALNDVVIKSAASSQMVRLDLFIDDLAVATYDADGIIVSTPTGSTAYNMAAGGPVIVPTVEAFCITPICPHSLAAKPIVVPATQRLRLVSPRRNLHKAVVSLDGQDVATLAPGESLLLARADTPLYMVNFGQADDNFYHLLNNKLHWADNPRNKR
jgi:NAD+ kinase